MAAKKFVRESKFRHIFGQNSPKDQQFEGINASSSRLDGNICACNRKFIAVVLTSSGGGIFTVLSRSKPGRYERLNKCVQHTSEVIDLCFDPFNPNRIISGAEDGSFIVWWIPDGGLESDLSEFQCILRGSQRRAVQACWHSSAADTVFCVNVDGIHIFDVTSAECIRSIDTGQYTEQLYNISTNLDSSVLAAVGKDKKVRIYDTYTGELKKDFQVHEGSKPNRVAWLYKAGTGQFVATTGATKMSERQICVWDIDNSGEALFSETLDSAAAVLNIHYDPDTNLVFLFSKGEVSVKMYEVENNGQMFFVSLYQTQEPQRAGCFGNKLSCNTMICEIMHMARVLPKCVEEVSYIVPRRSDQFQEDLYPDTFSEVPALTVQEFIQGKKANPCTVSLKNYSPLDGSNSASSSKVVPTGSMVGRATTMGMGSMKKSPALNTSGVSCGDIQSEISALRAMIQDQQSRIEELERKLG